LREIFQWEYNNNKRDIGDIEMLAVIARKTSLRNIKQTIKYIKMKKISLILTIACFANYAFSQVWENTNIKLTNPSGYPYGINIDNNYTGGWAREFSFSRNGTGKFFSFGAYGADNNLNYGYIGGNSSNVVVADSPWMIFKPNGDIGIGTIDNRGDKFHVNTGSQFFRVATWGIGVADSGWQHTLTLSNFNNYSEIFNNNGKPLILQYSAKGRVGIGTINPGYELDVIGTIRAREIKVDLNGADFVFEKDYKLMPLSELEKFIKEQKHLPEVAPAKEMEKNGTELGDLNSKLLQKMEEMTLYIIEQNKKIEALQEKIEKLEATSK
jgi:hypothetical protein